MRARIVAGNWKMNLNYPEAKDLAEGIMNAEADSGVQLLICPPAVYASELVLMLRNSSIKVGVQNLSEHESGAYTGELAASMLKSINVSHVIIGHSERRAYFGETNEVLALKVNQALSNQLTPIYCCGEQLSDRDSGNHFDVVSRQLEEGLFHLSEEGVLSCVIAYEPVWAIGTGVTATADQAQEMHAHIRTLLNKKYGDEVANKISILYGGSCKPSNAKDLFSNPDVDGGLIGGASLNKEDFLAIANSFA